MTLLDRAKVTPSKLGTSGKITTVDFLSNKFATGFTAIMKMTQYIGEKSKYAIKDKIKRYK